MIVLKHHVQYPDREVEYTFLFSSVEKAKDFVDIAYGKHEWEDELNEDDHLLLSADTQVYKWHGAISETLLIVEKEVDPIPKKFEPPPMLLNVTTIIPGDRFGKFLDSISD